MSIRTLQSLVSQKAGAASRLAWQAYCYFLFGDEYALADLKWQGRARYSMALSALYGTLHDGSIDMGFEILTAAGCLGLYEIHACTDTGNGWLRHEFGMAKLVESLGPTAFQRPDRLLFFEGLRRGIVFAAMLTHMPTNLASASWMTVPWAVVGIDRKTTDQLLLDIMLRIPVVMRTVDQLKADAQNTSIVEISQHDQEFYIQTLAKLQAWHRHFWSTERIENWQFFDEYRALFPHGFPVFRTILNSIVLSWYYGTLTIMYHVAEKMCLPYELKKHRLDNASFTIWPDVNIYPDISPRINHISEVTTESESSMDPQKITRLALRQRSRTAAYSACVAMLPLLAQPVGRAARKYANFALIAAMNSFDGSAIGDWARMVYYSPNATPDMQHWFHRSATQAMVLPHSPR